MVLSNPLTFIVAPAANVTRVKGVDMLVGEPDSGEWVLAATAYGGEPNVRVTFPGAQVSEYRQVRPQDAYQQVHYHGKVLITEALEVIVGATTYDADEEIVQRREVVLDAGPTGWVPFDLDLDLYDSPYFNLDISFVSSTATLYLDSLDLDVEHTIPYTGNPTLTPYSGLQVMYWNQITPAEDTAFDGEATADKVTLAEAQVDDPTITNPGGPDEFVRIDYDAYAGDGQWGLISAETRPVHRGAPLLFQTDIWAPAGTEGIEVRTVILDNNGNVFWNYEPTYIGYWDDDAVWVQAVTAGRSPIDGVAHIFVAGWANTGPGRAYLKNMVWDSGPMVLRYSSDFGASVAEWTPETGSLQAVVRDGIPALRLTGATGPNDWSFRLTPEIPLDPFEVHIVDFDFWVPADSPNQRPVAVAQVYFDPSGTNSYAALFPMSLNQPEGWFHCTAALPVAEAMGHDPAMRGFTLALDLNDAVSEALIANVQIASVSPV